jgi:hypothetical protein
VSAAVQCNGVIVMMKRIMALALVFVKIVTDTNSQLDRRIYTNGTVSKA